MRDQPKRPPSRAELTGIRTPDQPEREAVHHPGVDGVDQAPPRKSSTLTGLPAAPGLPVELAPTRPAPRNPLRHQTWRIPTPPSAMAQARRSEPPPTDGASQAADAATGQPDATARELAEARHRIAQYERDERARAEASLQTYPPAISEKSPDPRGILPDGRHTSAAGKTDSAAPDSKLDRALGQTIRLLFARYGWPLLAAAGIGGAVLKPAADPAKTEATLAKTEQIMRELTLTRQQLNGLLDREAARDVYLQCLAEQQAEYFAQLSPAPDKMGAAAPLKPFIDRCKSRKP